jgi:hypothetical protein
MNRRSKLRIPQGLKPASLLALGGTAEAVPLPKTIYEIAFSRSQRSGSTCHGSQRIAIYGCDYATNIAMCFFLYRNTFPW